MRACAFALSLFLLADAPLAWAQPVGAPPPEAKEAMSLGLEAAKEKDWKAAIKHFTEAKKTAPYAPPVLFNLAVAYDQLGGREFAAIAFYRAFLAVAPNFKNAEKIRKRISELTGKIEGVVVKLIDVAERMAKAFPAGSYERSGPLKEIAAARAMIGDMTSALAIAENDLGERDREEAYFFMARYLARAGKFPDAKNMVELVRRRNLYAATYGTIGQYQAIEGDVNGAIKTAAHIESLPGNSEFDRNSIMKAQATVYNAIGIRLLDNGDIEGAKAMAQKIKRVADDVSVTGEIKSSSNIYLVGLWIEIDLADAWAFAASIKEDEVRDLAFNVMADRLARAGNVAKAKQALAKTKKVNPWTKKLIDTVEQHQNAANDDTNEEQRRTAEQWLRQRNTPLGAAFTTYYTGLSLREKEAYRWSLAPPPSGFVAVYNVKEYIRGLQGKDRRFRASRIIDGVRMIVEHLQMYRRLTADWQTRRQRADRLKAASK